MVVVLLKLLLIICRKSSSVDAFISKLAIDVGSKNKKAITELTERYGVNRVVVSTYHLQANGMID